MSTNSGQSGSPIIWIKDNNKGTIIGIHKGTHIKNETVSNVGRLINADLLDTLEK